jgi:CheY-like chemotaxis protein
VPPTILIVDDSPEDRDRFRRALEPTGYSVVTAEDGPAALEYLASHPAPGAILVDLFMPGGMNGWVLSIELRKASHTRHIPQVIVSGVEDPRPAAGFLRVRGWLLKPFSDADLVETLGRIAPLPA